MINVSLDDRCDAWQDIVTATAALEEVKQSTKFAKILELILLIGNYMNAGSRNEQTLAFEFGFITKVWWCVITAISVYIDCCFTDLIDGRMCVANI